MKIIFLIIRRNRRIYLLTILILIAFLKSYAQEKEENVIRKTTRMIEENSPRNISLDSIIRSIQVSHDLTLGFSTYNKAWGTIPITYCFFSYTKSHCTAFRYVLFDLRQIGEKPYKLDSFNVDKKTSISVLFLAWNMRIWDLKDSEKENPCIHSSKDTLQLCWVDDGSSKSLISLTRDRQIVSSYYEPEYFEYECCPGNKNRKKFLEIYKRINDFFSKLKE